jgi:hypothetical protein
MKKYLFNRGRIVTITWKHGGHICKILARSGQFVYDTIKDELRVLSYDEYVVYNELWDEKQCDFVVAQENKPPIYGFLVNEIHLVPSTKYEKLLRRNKVFTSPKYDFKKPLGADDELIVLRRDVFNVRPRIRRIISAAPNNYLLSNGESIDYNELIILYRQPIDYEVAYYNRISKFNIRNNYYGR